MSDDWDFSFKNRKRKCMQLIVTDELWNVR